MKELLYENPYYSPTFTGFDIPDFTRTRINIYGGIKGNLVKKLNYHISARYAFVQDMAFFQLNPTYLLRNKFLVLYNDVNKSQSTNDVFPTAIRIASAKLLLEKTIPALESLVKTYQSKIDEFGSIKKIGRTHLMDATPLTLGEELSGHQSQVMHGVECLKNALKHLMELPVGGTAVGNGLNTPEGYDRLALSYINQFTGMQFVNAPNKFEAMASHDSMVEISGAMKRLAVSLMKIANDCRNASWNRCCWCSISLPRQWSAISARSARLRFR